MKLTNRILLTLASGLACLTLASCGGGGGGGGGGEVGDAQVELGFAEPSLVGKVLIFEQFYWEFQGSTAYLIVSTDGNTVNSNGNGSYTYSVTRTNYGSLNISNVQMNSGTTHNWQLEMEFKGDGIVVLNGQQRITYSDGTTREIPFDGQIATLSDR